MGKYLFMDGVDDTLVTYLTFTEIVIDMAPNNAGNSFGNYINAGGSSFSKLYDNDTWNGFNAVYKNGVLQTKGTPVVIDNVRAVYRIVSPTAITTNVFIFNASFNDLMKGNIYDIKFYNGATLVAWYDMNKGNVLDQSGNNKNATLNGGTWINTPNYYLQMDGISDYLRTPQVTIDRIVMEFTYEPNNPPSTTAYYLFDARGGTPSANDMVYVNTNNTLAKGSGVTSLKLDGVTVPTTANVTPSTKYTIDALYPSSISEVNGIEFFVNFAFQNTTRTKGKLYKITGYNAGLVAFHYNMELGNVQDQSGNGKHGVLTGGTWVDDSIQFFDGSITLSLVNNIYKDTSSQLNLIQSLFKDAQTLLSFNNTIYKDNQTTLNLVQSIFADKLAALDLKHVIYKDSINQLNLVQSIYEDIQTKIDLVQEMYNTGSIDLSLVLSIRDDIYLYKQVLETIFNIKVEVVSEFAIKREIETSFTINRKLQTDFTI